MTPGWHIGAREGRTHFYKEGGGGGFHAMMRLYRTESLGMVAMANATAFDVNGLLDTVARAILGG